MAEQPPEDQQSAAEDMDADEYGGLSIEDNPDGTVDPAELAGTEPDPADADSDSS